MDVSEILRDAGVTYSCKYVRETKIDDWACDVWSTWLNKVHFDYRTGLGLRELRPWKHGELGYNNGHQPRPGTLLHEQWMKSAKPVAPDCEDVLACLLRDGEALDTSFVDWCDNFGYDDDSIKARATYDACCEIGKQLRRLFTPSALAALRAALEDR
jgi:hypothetical protein